MLLHKVFDSCIVILAFFMDIPLAGVLQTTSHSEGANSFFNHFNHQKLSFVEL
jgi:hypothetical protein